MGMLEDDLTANPPKYGRSVTVDKQFAGIPPRELSPAVRSPLARQVREALHECTKGSTEAEFKAAAAFAKIASDETMLILRRLLR